MACVLVPIAEAIAVTVMAKVSEKKEKTSETAELSIGGTKTETAQKIPFSRKLRWLSNLLWGGSALLAFEHIWHGEVVPWFPFLTAVENPASAAEMLREMATVGVTMAIVVTAVWLCMLAIVALVEKKSFEQTPAEDGAAL